MQRQVEEINKVQKASQEREEVFSLTTILSSLTCTDLSSW